MSSSRKPAGDSHALRVTRGSPRWSRTCRVASVLTVSFLTAAACIQRPVDPPPAAASPAGDLPLITLDNFEYVGAFAVPGDQFGESSLNYAQGILEHAGNSMFVVGHNHHDAIAEFIIPELVNSTEIADLNLAEPPVQNFSRVLERTTSGNTQGIDWITGMAEYQGKLIVNAHRFYDGDGQNTHTTLVVSDAGNIAGSTIDGYFDLPGAARSGGWISDVPPEWQSAIGSTHLTGYASTTAIISRHSVGPSAHALDPNDVLAASQSDPSIETTKLMEFSLGDPLHEDLANESLANDLWTHKSAAVFGFIVPGSSTYAVLGSSGGHNSGIGYKITRSDGKACGGYCPKDPDDEYNFYWLFDVNDLLEAKAGRLGYSDIRPYEYGEFPAPFQPEIGARIIGGGTFDEQTGTLYLSVLSANDQLGRYKRPPIIVAYRIPVND